ncbi:MAG: DUF2269 domain-containing protein [Chloroflexota bacterium]|nr:DUF2269 domain-containing protein [Chloroflexota bacterium]
MQLFPWVLFLHVIGAILAFGPTFAYSISGAMGGREPQHANFAMRVTEATGVKLVFPLAIFQGVTGLALILIQGTSVMARTWLIISIVIYIALVAYALTVQRKAVHRAIELTSAPPPLGAPAGPPPELLATVKKIQRGGMMLGLGVVVIVFLMVVKPGI